MVQGTLARVLTALFCLHAEERERDTALAVLLAWHPDHRCLCDLPMIPRVLFWSALRLELMHSQSINSVFILHREQLSHTLSMPLALYV